MGAAAKQIVIQSFLGHRFTANFRDEKGNAIKQNGVFKTVTVPSKKEAPKNILIMRPEDFEAVRLDLESHLARGQNGGMTIIDDIPSGFWDPAARVSMAESRATEQEARAVAAETQLHDLRAEFEAFKEQMRKTYGWKE